MDDRVKSTAGMEVAIAYFNVQVERAYSKSKFLECLTHADGTDRLYRNVGKELPFWAA